LESVEFGKPVGLAFSLKTIPPMTPEQKNELCAIFSQISNLAGRAASILGAKSPPEELKLEGEVSAPPKPRVLPKGWKTMTKEDRKVKRVESNSPMMIEIGSWHGRMAKTLWTVEEAVLLHEINPTPEEFEGMKIFYRATIEPKEIDYRRTTLLVHLRHWNSTELDKARRFVKGLQP
jgi:hypothetical protein